LGSFGITPPALLPSLGGGHTAGGDNIFIAPFDELRGRGANAIGANPAFNDENLCRLTFG